MKSKIGGDHPREYGENKVVVDSRALARGSSPRIRGEYLFTASKMMVGGIIPANTGRMTSTLCSLVLPGDHPREYGENNFWLLDKDGHPGSSPRIRGECIS